MQLLVRGITVTAVISSEPTDLDEVCTRGLFLCAVLLPSRGINNWREGNWGKKVMKKKEIKTLCSFQKLTPRNLTDTCKS